MSIRRAIEKQNQEGATALIPYFMLGDPDLETTKRIVSGLAEAGATAVELGLPFTDPIADGPTIQKATTRALKHPFSLRAVFDVVKSLRADGCDIPIALYTYSNLIFNIGYQRFDKLANEAGIQGTLIVDLPPEEASEFMGDSGMNLESIFLCSPTTSPERLELIDRYSTAFTYYVAHKGVTGIRDTLPDGIKQKLLSLRKKVTGPLGVGFGISKPDHAKELASYADAIVIGSAYVQLFENYQGERLVDEVKIFTHAIVDVLSKT